MTNFEPGDRVEYEHFSPLWLPAITVKNGDKGTVIIQQRTTSVRVQWDSGKICGVLPEKLKLINEL